MSDDVSMLSDDDQPLRTKVGSSSANGSNGHVGNNGNGRHVESSPFSDDNDLPLVRTNNCI